MRRAASLVLLAWLGCKGGSEARDPSQPAGTVLELAGEVTAARAGAAVRPLVQGDSVFADDTITTGGDASAVILLAHNKVRWSLGAGKSVRVDASLAWKASEDEGSAFDDREGVATASAGRHTEREGGDTQATAPEPEGARAEAVPGAEPVAPSPKPPPEAIAEMAKKNSAAKDSPKKSSSDEALARALEQPLRGGAGGGVSAAAPNLEAAAAPRAHVTFGKITVKGPRPEANVTGQLMGFAARCGAGVNGTVTLSFEIEPSGAVKKVQVTGARGVVSRVKSCVVAASEKLRFPAEGGAATRVEQEIRFGAL